MIEETAKERQKRVVDSGGEWEEYVRIYLNDKLKGKDIEVIYGKREDEIKQRSLSLWESLTMPLKSSKPQRNIWGDLDLIAIKGDLPIAIISCKLSFHGRLTETLFWALLFKSLTRIKVVLASPDAGTSQKKEVWKSEFGTPQNPTKNRLLVESYLEAAYIDNVPEFCKYIKPSEGTVLGGVIRHLSELPSDIVRWSDELLRIYGNKKRISQYHFPL